jgi:hypothetical protein
MRELLWQFAYVFLCCIIGSTVAQDTTTNATEAPTPSSPLIFSMPATVTLCTNLTISWSGGSPSWFFSWQTSQATLGDESALTDRPNWLFTADDSGPVLFYFFPSNGECQHRTVCNDSLEPHTYSPATRLHQSKTEMLLDSY